ncbi:crotonyl-CoA carboxylase/reductase [Streptomyces sp. TRM66268-LWL]|uniref:Crotonyl-CoA carboxylase/reductase n=1 Tax=Streptomyces polyasparticus TaxID=2767826 RepID=A0ABR7SF29_9ACTN|nr:crotonyl-CoA carboxylase/reductase [Streptomyces polyasparticus]MBC9712958.1 crotonyl-CoA carboxylase/reductase [Streptomyces polyasparticus]
MHRLAEFLLDPSAGPEDFARFPLPDTYRAITVHRAEAGIFAGIPSRERDPSLSLHLDQVPVPEVGPGEALVAVMASSVNYNTVWSALFEPQPTFRFLQEYARRRPEGRRHDLPYHVLGSDLAGIVLRTGPGVTRWRPGDSVVGHCLVTELDHPDGHGDPLLDPEARIWGYETNFGGLADLALVKSGQLLPKPAHLTWEEAAVSGLVNSTAYRQLVSANGARMKQGDTVLIWGAAGGLGSYATQYVLAGGGFPVCVVSSPARARLCRAMGAAHVIDREAEGFRFWTDDATPDPREWRRFARRVRELTGGEEPDIVFEHPGRDTFGASVYTVRKGGAVATCASITGAQHLYDNRYLWTRLVRIVGTHFAHHREAWEANRLIAKGRIHPTLSALYPLQETAEAVRAVRDGLRPGKAGVLCLAPSAGLGVTDQELRIRHLPAINRFRTS